MCLLVALTRESVKACSRALGAEESERRKDNGLKVPTPERSQQIRRPASRARRAYRGNYYYRDGQKLLLAKVPDAFALRLREGRLPAELRVWAREGERLPPVALKKAYGRQRVATYRVRGAAAARDRAMDALRRDGHAPAGGAEDGSEKAADTGRLLMQ